LPEECSLEIRSGSLNIHNVCLIPVLFCLNLDETESGIFETWINVNQMGENPLTLLAVQTRIVIQLYGDSNRVEKTLEIPNPLQPLARKLLAELGNHSDWTVSKFDAALQECYKQFPTVAALWKGLPHFESEICS
jgi:hypothetical protein